MNAGGQTLSGAELTHNELTIPLLQPRLRLGKSRYIQNNLGLKLIRVV
jgi:hypothetical protein